MSKHAQRIPTKSLKSIANIPYDRQISVAQQKESKNLAAAETEQLAAGDKATSADIKGKIVEYLWWMKKQG